ncbi:protein tesmin/TSO1-like CXC 5 isoform X1 [Gossypium arboreum]|uniref:CRC domain-containing protein n=1 Tax=Gossypium arboreum TaxID=29729 RepID=A0ABR0PT70_GOSAR|nr:protein tesmin/TSO1-like CXC 5 isoform X1 [Gossypium arboreum]KAK5829883.1 hypothetical protein PVK06_013676 [Gossypium arboreum]
MDVASWSPAAASVNQRQQPQIKQQVAATISVAAGQSHPLTTASSSVVKPESLKAKTRPNELNDGAPKKQKHSNCKHFRCLKLYCECFASGMYCDECNCVNCYKNVEYEAVRRDSVGATLKSNLNAFRPKINSSSHGAKDNKEAGEVLMLGKHSKGCHCKRSGCLRKYCECFQANILCSESCKCMGCKKFKGSEERQALFHGDYANNMAYIQQAANATTTGAIGSSGYASAPVSKKRKSQELLLGSTAKDPSVHSLGHLQQTNLIRASIPSSSLSSMSVSRAGTAVGPSKLSYRSLFADIIQKQDLKELCSVLVVLSREAAKILADQRSLIEGAEDHSEISLASSTQDKLESQKDFVAEKTRADNCSSANQAVKSGPENSCTDVADMPEGRPMSPATLALMCDEQDTTFTAAASLNGIMDDGYSTSSQLPCGKGMIQIDAEHERVVLTKFRDCLNRLITFGEIKGKFPTPFSENSIHNELYSMQQKGRNFK